MINITGICNLISHKDKKELFINELVNFIENNSSDYLTIVKNWKIILNSYNKSYKLYLAGFSFEKIKTSSNEHFQKLLDRIYDSISKVSGYIFGIPIGFILLLNYFDYTGSLIFKNIVILLLSILFFVLIWFIHKLALSFSHFCWFLYNFANHSFIQ